MAPYQRLEGRLETTRCGRRRATGRRPGRELWGAAPAHENRARLRPRETASTMRLAQCLALLTCLLAADVHASTLARCGATPVRRDDAQARVLDVCGAPVFNRRGLDLEGRSVDRWYYLPANREPARILEFQEGALARVQDLPIDWVQCGTRRNTVVRRGDSKSVVIARCGAPEHTTVLGVAGGRRIEEWRYRLVRNGRRSTYTGTFLDDSLGFIEVFRDRRR